MNHSTSFLFRGNLYKVEFCLSFDEDPLFIFCIFKDPLLIRNFGDELTIKTDGHLVLPSRVDWDEINYLKEAVFAAIWQTAEYEEVTKKLNLTHFNAANKLQEDSTGTSTNNPYDY